MARCLAVAMSQAPGLSGTPDFGHCSSAATRASCAGSSARPTSRTIRARPAMSLGDSILQTASMARCVSVAVTASDQNIFDPQVQDRGAKDGGPWQIYEKLLLRLVREVPRFIHLANFGLAFPFRPVLPVKFHEALGAFDRNFFRSQLKLRVAANDFLGFGEGPILYDEFAAGNADAGAFSRWEEATVAEHRAGFDGLFAELPNGVH